MLSGVGVSLDDPDETRGARAGPIGLFPDDEMGARVARLTAGQLDCLRLVDRHLSSKEIAAELKISPHTVDQRVRQALATLGVERRTQAARLVAQHLSPQEGEYQRLIHQPPYIPAETETDQPEATVSNQIRHAGRAGEVGDAGFLTEQRPASFRSSLQPPFATRSNPRNEMSAGQRLFWVATIALGSAFSAGMYLAGLESLARLLKG
jgi:DNA-binding CsgD family transcriptional regulator